MEGRKETNHPTSLVLVLFVVLLSTNQPTNAKIVSVFVDYRFVTVRGWTGRRSGNKMYPKSGKKGGFKGWPNFGLGLGPMLIEISIKRR